MYRKSAYLFAVNTVNRSLNFVLRIVLRAVLGLNDYGMLAVILPVQNMILTITSYAVSPSVSKHVSEDGAVSRRTGLYPFAFLLVGAVLLCAGLLLAPLMASFLSDDFGTDIVLPLRIMIAVIPVGILFSILTGIFFGHQRARVVALALFVVEVATVVSAYALGWAGGVTGAVGAFLAGYLLGILCLLFPLKGLSLERSWDGSRARRMMLFSAPLMGTSLAIVTIFQVDIIILGRYYTTVETSLYGLVAPTARLIPALSVALSSLLLPKVSELSSRGQGTGDVITKALEAGFAASLPFALAIFAFSEEILYVLFNAVEAANALRILSVGMLCYALFYLCSSSLQGRGDTRPPLYAISIAAVADLVLCFVLIPPYGISGAAVATSLSLALALALVSFTLHLPVRPRLSLILAGIPLVAFERAVGIVGSPLTTLVVYGFVGAVFFIAYVKYAGLLSLIRDEEPCTLS